MGSFFRKISRVFLFSLITCTSLYILYALVGKYHLTFWEYKYILQYTLYLLFFLAFLTSFFLNKSKVFFLLLFLLLYLLMMEFYSSRAFSFYPFFNIFLLLFNLFFISSYKERGVFSSSGIRRISFIIIQFYFFYLLGNRTDIHNELLDLLLQVNRSIFLLSVLLFLLSLINIVKNFKSNEDYAFLFVLINIFVLFFNLQANYQLLTLVFTLLILLVFIFAILKDFYAMAYLDELTGLPGRRALREEVLKLGDYYSIAMLDIDYFKKFNDKFGHDVGDQALKMVASMIDRVKGGAKAYRYGGEEFTILFPGKSSKEAYPFLEELRESIASRPFIIRNNKRDKKKAGKNIKSGEEVRITVSIGLAEKTNKEKNPLEVIKKADQELYKAKRKGRNCVKL